MAERIVKTPGVCGGRARVAGTRIPVWVIIQWIGTGLSIDSVHGILPSLSIDDIEDAMYYAKHNIEEITRDINENET
jgi:type III restriction enzyme